tara:strand:- start:146 stop:742 length:597 start_codon:yes stop_codon:yes gene_type:complete
MNVFDIVNDDKKVTEAPTSTIGNTVKGLVGKLPGAERMAGSAEMGKEANNLYKILKRWQGINDKNDNTMTDQDFAAFMKQNNLSAGGMKLPQGVLPKKVVMDVLKKAAQEKLTGGNSAGAPSGGAGAPSGGGSASGGGGSASGGGGVLDKLQQQTGKKSVSGAKADPTGKPTGKLDPALKAKIEKLSDADKKKLVGML